MADCIHAGTRYTRRGLAIDSFVMLFIVLGFMFYLRAVKYAGSERLVRTTSIRPMTCSVPWAQSLKSESMPSNAVLQVAFGAANLGWKRFVVVIDIYTTLHRLPSTCSDVETRRFWAHCSDHVVNQSPNCSAILCTSSNEPMLDGSGHNRSSSSCCSLSS